jgi:putative hydrolase of the HAD superfamily
MTTAYCEIIRKNCRPAAPIPTGQRPRLTPLEGVRAVLFDVYGTMFISASGDVGTADGSAKSSAFAEAMAAAGLPTCRAEGPDDAQLLCETIRRHHDVARGQGIEYPEVEIRDVWRDVIAELGGRGQFDADPLAADVERLAVEYEVRANPVWPMPHVKECLAGLRGAGVELGIVSNAQFFTLELFPALLDYSIEHLGFSAKLRFFSYQSGQAKPGTFLYERAKEALSSLAIHADEVVYVGNDLLNDVVPAQAVGFRTALFAGDARSLRLREGDPRVEGVQPDLVLTDLAQLKECLNC